MHIVTKKKKRQDKIRYGHLYDSFLELKKKSKKKKEGRFEFVEEKRKRKCYWDRICSREEKKKHLFFSLLSFLTRIFAHGEEGMTSRLCA